MKRHLVIDARCVRASPTGIGNAALRQLEGLESLLASGKVADWRVTAIRLGSQLEHPDYMTQWKNFRHIHMVDSGADPTAHPSGEVWLHGVLPGLLRRLEADVHYGPAYAIPARVSRDVARLVMFHDDLAWSHPDSYPWKFRHFTRMQMRLAAWVAERLIFPSESAKRACARRLSLDASRVGVVPHGIIFRDSQRSPAASREPIIVCVASAEARKNQEVLARALSGRKEPRLVLVGYAPRHAGQLDRIHAHGAPLEIIPVATPAQVDEWLGRAAVFALPTLGEGFGFPVIEAMAAGTPLLLSDLDVMREVAGDAAVYLPPDDPKAWGKAIDELLADPARRQEMAAKGLERLEKYTVESCGERLLDEAEKALPRRRRARD